VEHGYEFGVVLHERIQIHIHVSTCCNKYEVQTATIYLSTCRKLNISTLIEAIFLRPGRRCARYTPVKVRACENFAQKTQSCKNLTTPANIFYHPAISANHARECAKLYLYNFGLGQWMYICVCARGSTILYAYTQITCTRILRTHNSPHAPSFL